MDPNISEFSYGYALTNELMRRYRLNRAGAPTFPSLQQEGQTGGGYDVELPLIALFLQFKLSRYMKGVNSKHAGVIGLPHYRADLRARKYSKQHELLLDLEADGKDVYYCAPMFHEPDELNQAFVARDVTARSVFFRPSAIGELPDDDEHFIAFQPGATQVWFCSDPKEIVPVSPADIFSGRLGHRRTESITTLYESLANELLQTFERSVTKRGNLDIRTRRLLDASRQVRAAGRAEERAGLISLTLFGCDLLVLNP
jgi:hypothetical protein